jgi:hypothetical protein
MGGRAFAAAAGVAVLVFAATAMAATRYESRTVSVTKTVPPGKSIALDGKITSGHRVAGCYARIPVRLERRRLGGRWSVIRSSRTTAKGLFSWTIVGFRERARIVVPTVTAPGLVCAQVVLGFDRGYLSPG